MISGAMATIGVTCSTTAQGWIAACASRLNAMAMAIDAPRVEATISAVKVTVRVDTSEVSSPIGSARNAPTIATGPGTRYTGTWPDQHRRLPRGQRQQAEQGRGKAQEQRHRQDSADRKATCRM